MVANLTQILKFKHNFNKDFEIYIFFEGADYGKYLVYQHTQNLSLSTKDLIISERYFT